MADRILHWHIPEVLSGRDVTDTDVYGNAFRMDRDYRVLDTWLRVKEVPVGIDGQGIQIDINDDGTSIYGEGQEPNLPDGTQEITSNTFSSPGLVLKDESVITLDVDQVGQGYSGLGLVVELYLANA